MNASASLHSYRFQGLPKVRREELEFFNAMAHLTPTELVPETLPGQLLEVLTPYIRHPIQWQWTGTSQVLPFSQLERICVSPTLIVLLRMLPMQMPLIVEIDPRLSSTMVDLTLGGSGERVEIGKPLSEIERGVLTYLFVKLIHTLQLSWGQQAQTEFRFADMADDIRTYSEMIPPETGFYRREIHCTLNGQGSFVRVHIPTTYIQEIVRELPDTRHTQVEYDLYRQRLGWMADAPVQGFLRVGTVDLSEADFQDLQADDIVLIRECSVQRREEDGLWEGQGLLQFSERPNFAVRCSLQNETTHPRSQILLEEVIQLGEPPMIGTFDRSEYHMEDLPVGPGEYEEGMDPQAEMGDENYEEMGPIISDVPVPLIVELGRVECRMRDLAYMRVGQVIELKRSPHEPLHLVVNNQIMGRGELVEIDGQLGIRIIELAK